MPAEARGDSELLLLSVFSVKPVYYGLFQLLWMQIIAHERIWSWNTRNEHTGKSYL